MSVNKGNRFPVAAASVFSILILLELAWCVVTSVYGTKTYSIYDGDNRLAILGVARGAADTDIHLYIVDVPREFRNDQRGVAWESKGIPTMRVDVFNEAHGRVYDVGLSILWLSLATLVSSLCLFRGVLRWKKRKKRLLLSETEQNDTKAGG